MNKKVLDFGCGSGGFLLHARGLASTVNGVELEKRLQQHFKNSSLEVFSRLEEMPADEQYDIITAFHVIEHLPDPRDTLQKLSKHLRDGGEIVIEVPNANDALLTVYRNEAFSNFAYWSCHLYLFTVETLVRLSRQAGLTALYIKQIQRYPLSNHLNWLACGEPGGHKKFYYLNTEKLRSAYEEVLAGIQACDTIIAGFTKGEDKKTYHIGRNPL